MKNSNKIKYAVFVAIGFLLFYIVKQEISIKGLIVGMVLGLILTLLDTYHILPYWGHDDYPEDYHDYPDDYPEDAP